MTVTINLWAALVALVCLLVALVTAMRAAALLGGYGWMALDAAGIVVVLGLIVYLVLRAV